MKYIKLFIIFIISFFRILLKKEITVTFKKIKSNWYCDIKGWPKEFFANTLMVGNASLLIDNLSESNEIVTFNIIISNKEKEHLKPKYWELVKTSSNLTTGAYYNIDPDNLTESLWLCPVTLFVFSKYPKYIYFKVK